MDEDQEEFTPQYDIVGDSLISEFARLTRDITAHEFPRLLVEEYEDEDEETAWRMRCPRCGEVIEEGEQITAIDMDVRSSYFDIDEPFDFANQRANISGHDETNYDATMWYEHVVSGCYKQVSLPDGWRESWL